MGTSGKSTASTRPAERNRAADTVRGVAAIGVMNAHFLAAFFPGSLHSFYPGPFRFAEGSVAIPDPIEIILSLLYSGHFGVMVFFVMSGFVLSQPFFADDKPALSRRLFGRYLRLNLPIAASIAIAFAMAMAGLYFNADVAAETGNMRWLARYYDSDNMTFQNFAWDFFIGGAFEGSATFNPPLWSLKVELLGSLLLLAVLCLTPRQHFFPALAICSFITFALFHATAEFLWMVSMFLGAAIHRIPRTWIEQKGLVVAALVLGVFLGGYQHDSALYAWIPNIADIPAKSLANVAGALLLLTPILLFDYKILHSRMGDFLGRISFAVYLLHFPILCSIACYLYLNLEGPAMPIVTYLVYAGVTIIAAYFFERFVDRPSQRLASRFGRHMITTSASHR